MGLTRFPHGVSSFGMPVFGSGLTIEAAKNTEIFFVSKGGSDGSDGKSPDTATLTVQAAVDKCSHDKGSYVLVGEGVFSEQVTITKRAIHLIGMGPSRTKIAAGTMATKGAYLTYPVIAVQPIFKSATMGGVEIANLTVDGGGGYGGIYLGDGANGDGNASNSEIHDCVIDGSNREGLVGILIEGGSFINIHNNIIASWTRAGVVITGGAIRTGYYNVINRNHIISGGTCGVALQGITNSNIISNNIFCDDSTTAFTSCIQVANLNTAAYGGACSGTDNLAAFNALGSAGTNGALLGANDHLVMNYGRNAGTDASSYQICTATWGSL